MLDVWTRSIMTVLENYATYSLGSHSETVADGRVFVTNEVVARDELYRNGTGRRKKPTTPDETPYERTMKVIRTPRGTGTKSEASRVYSRWNGFLPQFQSSTLPLGLQAPTGVFDTNIRDQANLKALKKFDHKDLDLGTAWAERSKTAGLVQGIAQTTVEALNAIRKKNGRELLNVLGLDHQGARGKGVVDAYLAYHYGIKPALQEVSGAVQALARTPANQWQVTCEGRQAYESQKSTLVNLGGNVPYLAVSSLLMSNRTKITAIQRPITREQDILWSLGLDNPLGTLYETTPYSFVFDWIVPVGDWISALNSIKYYSGWQTVSSDLLKEEMVPKSGSGTHAGIFSATTSIGGGFYKLLKIRRTILNNLPLVGLPIKDPRSVDHMAKALSLLASNMANSDALPRMIRY